MSCRHCTTVVSSSSWPTCRLSSPPRRSSTQRLPRWRSLKLWMRILSFSAKEIFSVCKKMTWKGRGSLHDLLIHHLSLCVGEAKTGGCSSVKIWELMLTVVGKQVHVPDLYHQDCTLCTWCSRCCMILSGLRGADGAPDVKPDVVVDVVDQVYGELEGVVDKLAKEAQRGTLPRLVVAIWPQVPFSTKPPFAGKPSRNPFQSPTTAATATSAATSLPTATTCKLKSFQINNFHFDLQ